MAKALGCAAFDSSIGTTESKASRLEAWRRGDGAEGSVIVATKALGLGIDVADVRLVVHAGMPRRLRDFVQESGRAGRDGQASRSVVVCSRGIMEEEEANQREEWTRRFVSGEVCRRMILDKVMDGRVDRSGCEEGEKACEICQQKVSDVWDGDWDWDEGESESEGERIRAAFETSQQTGRFHQWRAREERRQLDEEAETFKGQLAQWVGRCTYCGIRGREDEEHIFKNWPWRQEEMWVLTTKYKRDIEEAIFGKKMIFRSCFHCGLPPGWCQRWKASNEDGGRFAAVKGGSYQYKGVMIEMFAVAAVSLGRHTRRADGLGGQASSEKEVYEW
ncbi:hypothetical protein CPLU01_16035 [Colletotrichum plurivorum]|uniref:DNA 3'-5' helicase n=1 Tax=Colletotrichum plurivorum TaxID=2175906 RepID=A0A8H6MPY5_9PEZI|nr:hypothetical protein CPLU01_16035 [Colletotrichum plurivorum]